MNKDRTHQQTRQTDLRTAPQSVQWGHVGIPAVSAARTLKGEPKKGPQAQQAAGVMTFEPDSD